MHGAQQNYIGGTWVGDLPHMIFLASIWAIPVIVAITFHEAAHGFVARLLGDDTALRLGRVSFNPLRHIDPIGTILLPGLLLLLNSPFLFGYQAGAGQLSTRNGRRREPRIVAGLDGRGDDVKVHKLDRHLDWAHVVEGGTAHDIIPGGIDQLGEQFRIGGARSLHGSIAITLAFRPLTLGIAGQGIDARLVRVRLW
jgi:hypothetical protein